MAKIQITKNSQSRGSKYSNKWYRLPRWAVIVVTFLVAAVGIFTIINSLAANATRLFCVAGRCTQRDPGASTRRTIVDAWVRPDSTCPSGSRWALRTNQGGQLKRNDQWLCVDTFENVRREGGLGTVFPVPGGSLPAIPDGGHGTYTAFDISAPANTPVYAFRAGVVENIGSYSVYIRGNDGLLYSYLHINVGNVSRGNRVNAGTLIGSVSGSIASGNRGVTHLHIDASNQSARSECSRNGCSNPQAYINIYNDLVSARGRALRGSI